MDTKSENSKHPLTTRIIILLTLLLAVMVTLIFLLKTINPDTTSEDTVSITVDTQLNAIQDLASYEYVYSDYTTRESTRSLAGIEMPGTKNTVVIIYSGRIKFGFSMEDLTYTLDDEEGILKIHLPGIKVLDNYIDTDSIRTYEVNNVFNPISNQSFVESLQSEKERHLEEAKTEGVLELAKKHAEDVISSLFSAFYNYEVVFE